MLGDVQASRGRMLACLWAARCGCLRDAQAVELYHKNLLFVGGTTKTESKRRAVHCRRGASLRGHLCGRRGAGVAGGGPREAGAAPGACGRRHRRVHTLPQPRLPAGAHTMARTGYRMQSCGCSAACTDRAVSASTLLHSPDCQRVRVHSICARHGWCNCDEFFQGKSCRTSIY